MVAAFSEPGTPGKDQTISVGHIEAGVYFLSPPPAVLVDTANTRAFTKGWPPLSSTAIKSLPPASHLAG